MATVEEVLSQVFLAQLFSTRESCSYLSLSILHRQCGKSTVHLCSPSRGKLMTGNFP